MRACRAVSRLRNCLNFIHLVVEFQPASDGNDGTNGHRNSLIKPHFTTSYNEYSPASLPCPRCDKPPPSLGFTTPSPGFAPVAVECAPIPVGNSPDSIRHTSTRVRRR